MKISRFISLFYLITFLSPLFAMASDDDQMIEGFNTRVFRPATIDEDKKIPLLIVLHGCSQKYTELASEGNFQEIAENKKSIIVLPQVPNGGVYMGCWDYYGMGHKRDSGDVGKLINLTKSFLNDPSYSIDNEKVYVAGLSSGGGMAMLLGCIAPDIFSGIGLNAGPTIGSTAMQIGRKPYSSAETPVKNCLGLAAENKDYLLRQKTGIIHGDSDYIVSKAHNILNAEVLSSVYEAQRVEELSLENLPGTHKVGTGKKYFDEEGIERIFIIENEGLGHAWPVGNGQTRSKFINKKSLDFTSILIDFLNR